MNAMRSTKRTDATLLILGALAAGACGSDAVPGAANGGSGGNGSNGASAGDPDGSAGSPDAAAGADASGGANGPAGDASIALDCELEPEQLTVEIDSRGSHTWDALQLGDTVHLAYEVTVCESEIVAQAQRLDYLTFQSTGAMGEASPVANYAEGACFFTRTPTLAPGNATDPLLFYTTTSSGASELYQKQLGDDSAAVRLTLDPESISDAEEHVVVAPFGPSNLLAYVNAYPALQRPSIAQIVTRRVGFAEQQIVSADAALHVADLALAAFPEGSSLGGMLAWVADVGDPAAISAQLLDKAGKATGDPIVLSEKVGAFSNVRIAMLPAGSDSELAGAIVYGVALDDLHTELRFRTIGSDGSFGAQRDLTTSNRNAQGVAIAPFADGYVVAFRAIDGPKSSIALKFLDRRGEMASGGERTLVGADTSGTPPELFVTSDGRLSVVFANENGDGMTLRAVRGTCDP